MTFYDLTIARVKDVLKTSEQGLSNEEATLRLLRDGRNELPKNPPPGWPRILLRQFWSPLMLILLAAMAASVAFGDDADAIMISLAVAVNVAVGFIQENKAGRALNELRAFSVPSAVVRRGGNVRELPAAELVAGDVILLEPGRMIPADARLVRAESFETDEAVLTGESLPVGKTVASLALQTPLAERTNMVFGGTLVTRGRAEAIVTATGHRSEIGAIAEMVVETQDDRSPLQEQFIRLSRFLAGLYSLAAVSIFAIGLALGKSLFEMFLLSTALAVAAVPEGLLVAVTVVLAIGMQRMLKRKALVRRLVATETLGSVSVICTDKTGTITQASMQVVSIVTPDHEFDSLNSQPCWVADGAERAVFIGVLCNDASIFHQENPLSPSRYTGSPTEIALLTLGEGIGLLRRELDSRTPRTAVLPFDAKHKFMLVRVLGEAGEEILMKGAAEVVLGASTQVLAAGGVRALNVKTREELAHQAETMTERGLRVLGCAYRPADGTDAHLNLDDARDMVFVGFMGLRDPVRPSAASAIKKAASAGVRTVVITGDHPRTARAIAREVGLGHLGRVGSGFVGDHRLGVMTGAELDTLSDENLRERVVDIDVYARVEPAHKVRIVRAWRARGETVAMIGDGVNDAPALKAADIGVAQGNGTDVTKQVADMVLLDSNLETIVSAIEEGRIIFDNIRKTTMYLLLTGFSEMSLIFLGLLFGLPLPLLTAQILYINFVTDGLPSVALTMDPGEHGVMRESPRRRGTPVLTGRVKGLVFGLGTLLSFLPFGLYALFLASGASYSSAQTIAFTAISLQALAFVFSIRSVRRFLWEASVLNNRFLLWSLLGGTLATLLAVYWRPLQSLLSLAPLRLSDWVWLSIMILIELVLIEAYKFVAFLRPRNL